ncbi:MAG TPA: BamA/TamA family outer membrane protein [Vicinamibacterales bacterium]|nr:BamA/TamA family outer membrane protein [Vicinamibacterales bacterium]
MRSRRAFALGLAVLLAASAAEAQQPVESPAPDAAAARAARAPAQDPERQDEGFVDRARRWVERSQIIERLTGEVDGWYPRLGGMTRGSGFALGPGYRTHLGGVLVDLSAGLSIRRYKALDAKVRWVSAFDERLEVWTNYRFEDFPQEDFFGLGLDSAAAWRTSYDFDSSEVTVHGLVRPLPWLRAGTIVGYMSPEIGPGTDDRYPSIEQLFTDAEAPGLAAQPDFLHTTLFADVDYLDEPGNPRRGGHYRVSLGIWDDRTLQQFDFRRFEGVLEQFVPLGASRSHVLSGRLGFAYVNNETGERVPFYFLPYIGGVDTVRSFREFRFKHENALWTTIEYRWIPFKYFSAAAFVDAGKVAADWQDITFGGMKTGYGFGLRVHTRTQTFARVDVGTGGGEGWQVFVKLGPRF